MAGGFKHAFRFLRVGWTVGRFGALEFLKGRKAHYSFLHFVIDVLSFLTPVKGDVKSMPAGQKLAKALEALGPAYVKLGQTFATRADLVGEDIARELSVLQDRLPGEPANQIIAAIEACLEQPLDDLFSHFDPEPVAAASIAQVHFATTREGADVAVKVLRTGIEEKMDRDLQSFFWLARLFERYMERARRLRPVEVVQTLADTIEMELDLRMEAAAASELRDNMGGEKGYRVPSPYWDLTAKRVLTMERVKGTPIKDARAAKGKKWDPKDLSETVVRVFLTQAIRDGFFHADLHQGNFFIEDDGTLVPVDFGIMGRLSKKSRDYLVGILWGFAERDYRKVADLHFDAGYVPEDQDRALFAQAMRAIAEPAMDKPLKETSPGDMLLQLFQTTERFNMRTQPQLLVLQRSMVMVEGLALTLNPDVNMWKISRPVLEKMVRASIGPEQRIKEALACLKGLFESLPDVFKPLKAFLAELDQKLREGSKP